jgi:dTDP-glucose pyrophosphorylase
MILGGATKLCFVISPGKGDILEYYGSRLWGADIAYVVQSSPAGLCDAVFRAGPLIPANEDVVIGLPDTIWTPVDALRDLPAGVLSFLLFPVARPELFDAVLTNERGQVREIQVKKANAASKWIWGAFKMPGSTFHELYEMWRRPDRQDEYFGTLINAWIAQGNQALGVRAGDEYVDVGTLNGYRHAMQMLARGNAAGGALNVRQRQLESEPERLSDDHVDTAA